MRIGLDLRMKEVMTGGIKRYTERVFEELVKINPDIFYPMSKEQCHNIPFTQKMDYWVEIPKSNPELSKMYSRFNVEINNLDIAFSTFYPIVLNSRIKTVITIHDLIPIIYPEFLSHIDMKNFYETEIYEATKSAAVIISDSEATKRDIIKFFGIEDNKIKVVYLGCDINNTITPSKKVLEIFNLREFGYILSVCTLEPRKNLDSVIEAFNQIKTIYSSFKLVLVGALGWKYDSILEKIQKSPFSEDIILTGFVDDEQLISLYNYAAVFAYPSFYEGFGLPVLEAMAYGAPVITAKNSSLNEVGGDACLYCNPNDPSDLAEKMLLLIENEVKRNELISLGKNRAKLFTWKKAAHQIYDILINLNDKDF